jgi:hypothetical protein
MPSFCTEPTTTADEIRDVARSDLLIRQHRIDRRRHPRNHRDADANLASRLPQKRIESFDQTFGRTGAWAKRKVSANERPHRRPRQTLTGDPIYPTIRCFLARLFGTPRPVVVDGRAQSDGGGRGRCHLGLPTRCNERVTLASSAAILLETCFHAFKGSRASV